MVFGNKLGINIALLSCWSQPLNLYWEVGRARHGELERQQKAERKEIERQGKINTDLHLSPFPYIPAQLESGRQAGRQAVRPVGGRAGRQAGRQSFFI